MGSVNERDQIGSDVARLRRTFDGGRTRSVGWRVRQLEALSGLLSRHEREIAAALQRDLGRPAADAWLADIAAVQVEITTAKRNVKKWMADKKVRMPWTQWPAKGRVHREPLGLVVIIGPWNYPFYLALGPLVGVLAAGNCAVIKPSELAPASSRLLADLLPRHLDSDAVAVVEGGAVEVSSIIEQRVDHIIFTGGPTAGRKVMAAAAAHLTPVTLELGGKSPVIVTAEADIEVAARRIVWAKLMNSGQTCIAPDHILVSRSVTSQLVEAIVGTLAEFRANEAGGLPIVDRRQFDRIALLMKDHGGQVICGGGSDSDALTFEPTIILDPDLDAPVMRDEIFGPILPIVQVGDLDAALGFVRAREKPLALYLFSSSQAEAARVVGESSSGGVVVNHMGLHCMTPALPFGGVGNSGMGAYHGKWGFDTFSHRKAVLATRTRPDLPLLYPPVSKLKGWILRRLF
ncbi:aldehyde dehydrogenase family protein [Haloechinothrix salitolerans]|uniref:Aldehyde dehydrogenase n=1 Tax=Haloechinothrix salitolerans TaxID=926830 RepID=A0ABW2C2C9_9PSEU